MLSELFWPLLAHCLTGCQMMWRRSATLILRCSITIHIVVCLVHATYTNLFCAVDIDLSHVCDTLLLRYFQHVDLPQQVVPKSLR